jgi:hypothetical protein
MFNSVIFEQPSMITMKKILLIILLLSAFSLQQLKAQCTPVDCSTSLPPYGGLCDTAIADGVLNQSYNEQLSLVLGGVCFNVQLLDPSLPSLNARITAVRNITFTNVPPGMSAATDRASYNPPNGGRVLGCVSISGTPQQAGVFAIRIGLVADAVLCGIFPIPQNGNAVDFNFNFTIRPDATFTLPAQKFCIEDAAVDLTVTGSSGGFFSGSGVVGNTFSPALAGVGQHVITYTVAAQEGNAIAPAFNSFSITVEVSDEKNTFYADEDGDGFGNPDHVIEICGDIPPDGFVSNNEDCDDTNAAINPETIWYQDFDADGYTTGSTLTQCEQPAGYVRSDALQNLTAFDCDDANAAINPGATEVCDGLDNNCNGLIDANDPSIDPSELSTWYFDQDGDGFGNAELAVQACTRPEGYVSNNDDCDDTRAEINPTTVWYFDGDNDGWPSGTTQVACIKPEGAGWKLAAELLGTEEDCDDENPGINPATVWYEDKDSDGYSSGTTLVQCERPDGFKLAAELLSAEEDCDDDDPTIYPGAEEILNDGIDQDCDGEDLISTAIQSLQTLQASVFPNPNQGSFILQIHAERSGAYELRIMDSKGSTLESNLYQLSTGVHNLNIAVAHRGMILVSVIHDQGQFLGKVVVH